MAENTFRFGGGKSDGERWETRRLLDREHEPVLEACEAAGTAFLPWRPVGPAATGQGVDETPDEGAYAAAEIAAVAAELGATPAQVALAWLLHRSPVVLPIPGTSRITHLEENVAAAGLSLTSAQRSRLDGLDKLADVR